MKTLRYQSGSNNLGSVFIPALTLLQATGPLSAPEKPFRFREKVSNSTIH